jgi:D-alanine-D-alanine ligase
LKLCVLLGGDTVERDVSLKSGRAMIAALREAGHSVDAFDPTYGPHDEDSSVSIRPIPADHEALKKLGVRRFVEELGSGMFSIYDAVVLALHGGSGEDGRIQSVLELAGVRYTASGPFASALGMDKTVSRVVLRSSGVPVAKGFSLRECEVVRGLKSRISRQLGWPVVVKPSSGGSTVGLSIVRRLDDLDPALELAFQHDYRVIVEKYISGREVTVAILDDVALPVVEIAPGGGFYDYEHKYQDGDTVYKCPAPISSRVEKTLRELGLKAFRELGCRGYARVDFRLPPSGKPICLEVNTLPGMTSHSLVPMAAEAVGISFVELCDRIVRLTVDDSRS